MAKFKTKTRNKPPVAPDAKVAAGKISPPQASKIKHKADAVLGKNDCKYHNC